MSKPRFVNGDDYEYEPGTVWFLVHTFNTSNASETWSLSKEPGRANKSHEPLLHGWLGTTNNYSQTASGMVRIAADGSLEPIAPPELATVLAELGYPELIPA